MDPFDLPDVALPFLLPATLWAEGGAGARSRELSCLYAYPYQGPHVAAARTSHDFWELLVIQSGTGRLDAEPTHDLRPGMACLIPPAMAHREESAGTMEVAWVGLWGSMLDRFDTTRVQAAESAVLVSLAERLWMRAERAYGLAGPELDGLAHALLGCFLRVLNETPEPGADLIDRAVEYLHGYFAEPLSVGAVASRFGYSEGHFHRQFKARTGRTPLAYLTTLRMREARKLLFNSRLPVAKVARLAGYGDPLYFSRAFRRETGLGPREFRRQARQGACIERRSI